MLLFIYKLKIANIICDLYTLIFIYIVILLFIYFCISSYVSKVEILQYFN